MQLRQPHERRRTTRAISAKQPQNGTGTRVDVWAGHLEGTSPLAADRDHHHHPLILAGKFRFWKTGLFILRSLPRRDNNNASSIVTVDGSSE